MGEAILTKVNRPILMYNASKANAIIRITGSSGISVSITGNRSFNSTIGDSGVLDIMCQYGSYTVKAGTYSTTVNVTDLKIYTVNIPANYKIIANLRTYGIKIDLDNSEPDSAVTYTNDAIGLEPLYIDKNTGFCNYGGWKNIINNLCTPCLVKDGELNGYLKLEDYGKYIDETDADITSGNSGDVMIEFPKFLYKYYKEDNYLYFKITNDEEKINDGYISTAFKNELGEDSYAFYYGAYHGCLLDGKIRSLTNKFPTEESFASYRKYCKANSELCDMESFAKRQYILGLLMLVTKSRDLKNSIGICNEEVNTTGLMDSVGLFYAKDGMIKCFGIENLWGINSWVDGIMTTSNSSIGCKGYGPYNDNKYEYENHTDGFVRNVKCYPTNIKVVLNGAGIIPISGQMDPNLGWKDKCVILDKYGCKGIINDVIFLNLKNINNAYGRLVV